MMFTNQYALHETLYERNAHVICDGFLSIIKIIIKFAVQLWNLSYPNSLGAWVAYKSKTFTSLKLFLKQHKVFKICIIQLP